MSVTGSPAFTVVRDVPNARVPVPPRWEEQPSEARGERWREGVVLRVACGVCKASVIVLPSTVATAIPTRNLGRVRRALAELIDEGWRYALVDSDRHFPCPACGHDQYIRIDNE
jgi:hypothetical protein